MSTHLSSLLNGPYQAEADMNEDGEVSGLDVDSFVAPWSVAVRLQFPNPQHCSSPSSPWPWSAAGGSVTGKRSGGAKQSRWTPQRPVCGAA